LPATARSTPRLESSGDVSAGRKPRRISSSEAAIAGRRQGHHQHPQGLWARYEHSAQAQAGNGRRALKDYQRRPQPPR
jgi:hypothetical protein